MQPNSPRCPGQPPMTEDGLAPVSAGPRRAPYPPATPIQGTWGAWPWLPARPRKQTSGHCTGVLPILFLDFSRLSCFLLETCRLHVCAGKHRGVQPKTHTDPQVPARPDPQTCWSRDRLPVLPDLPLAFGLRAHTSHPPPRTDRPSRTPFGSDRDAAARMVEVSGSSVPAGVGWGGAGLHLPMALKRTGCPAWGRRGRCKSKSFWFGSVSGGSRAHSTVGWLH